MTAETDRLNRTTEHIDRVLTTTITGIRPHSRTVALVDLALEHAEAWLATRLPGHGTRGGSTHPIDLEDAAEDRRLARQVLADIDRLPVLCRDLDRLANELYRMVIRLTQVVDHAKLPRHDGCRSCARAGHWSPVYEKTPHGDFCRWCYDYHRAQGTAPPAEAVDLYHRQSPQAAGRWLSQSVTNGR